MKNSGKSRFSVNHGGGGLLNKRNSLKLQKFKENNSKIILETFVTVYKNIGTKEKIEEIEE